MIILNSNNNINRNFDILDFLSLISFFAQMKNMNDDDIAALKNNKVIQAVANEIDKLHKENDDIINYLKRVDDDEQKIIRRLDSLITILERRL